MCFQQICRFRYEARDRSFHLQIGGGGIGGAIITGSARSDWGGYLMERVFGAGLSIRRKQGLDTRCGITNRDLAGCDLMIRKDVKQLFEMVRGAVQDGQSSRDLIINPDQVLNFQ